MQNFSRLIRLPIAKSRHEKEVAAAALCIMVDQSKLAASEIKELRKAIAHQGGLTTSSLHTLCDQLAVTAGPDYYMDWRGARWKAPEQALSRAERLLEWALTRPRLREIYNRGKISFACLYIESTSARCFPPPDELTAIASLFELKDVQETIQIAHQVALENSHVFWITWKARELNMDQETTKKALEWYERVAGQSKMEGLDKDLFLVAIAAVWNAPQRLGTNPRLKNDWDVQLLDDLAYDTSTHHDDIRRVHKAMLQAHEILTMFENIQRWTKSVVWIEGKKHFAAKSSGGWSQGRRFTQHSFTPDEAAVVEKAIAEITEAAIALYDGHCHKAFMADDRWDARAFAAATIYFASEGARMGFSVSINELSRASGQEGKFIARCVDHLRESLEYFSDDDREEKAVVEGRIDTEAMALVQDYYDRCELARYVNECCKTGRDSIQANEHLEELIRIIASRAEEIGLLPNRAPPTIAAAAVRYATKHTLGDRRAPTAKFITDKTSIGYETVKRNCREMEDRDDELTTPAITRRIAALKEVFLTGEAGDVFARLRHEDEMEKSAAHDRPGSPVFRDMSDDEESEVDEDVGRDINGRRAERSRAKVRKNHM